MTFSWTGLKLIQQLYSDIQTGRCTRPVVNNGNLNTGLGFKRRILVPHCVYMRVYLCMQDLESKKKARPSLSKELKSLGNQGSYYYFKNLRILKIAK